MSDRMRIVRSACRGCHGVCQVLVHLDGDRVVSEEKAPEYGWKRSNVNLV